MFAEPPNDKVFEKIIKVYLPRWRSYLNTVIAIFSRTPLQIAYYQSKKFSQQIDKELKTADVSLAHLIRTGEYLRKFNSIPKILEMTDAISLNYKRVKDLNERFSYKSWIYSFESNRLVDYEKEIINQFDLVSLVSDVDKEFLTDKKPNDRLIVCTNGVELGSYGFLNRVNNPRIIIYIGNMHSVQNLDACYYFANTVLPEIVKVFDVKFRIVGRITEIQSAKLNAFRNVEVTGCVDDVAEAVRDAWLGVCPVRIGAGVQNKILEYMALGLPTISSSIGVEGLSSKIGKDLLVADSASEYISHIKNLIASEQYFMDIACSGRNYVEKNHDWSSKIEPLANSMLRLVRDLTPN